MPPTRENHYDVAIVGTGFSSSMFLHGILKHRRKPSKVLVLESGPLLKHATLVKHQRALHLEAPRHFENTNPDKPWYFSTAHGGGSNCWFGSTPRMLPNDFALQSRYGVGSDWPVSYDQLEPFCSEAEHLLGVCGPQDGDVPYPMSRPYPGPPHRPSTVDRHLKRTYPDRFFYLPSARRAFCCGNGVCNLCPVNAKFTIESSFSEVYAAPGVELVHEAPATQLIVEGGSVRGVAFTHRGQEYKVRADLVALGANALFNPFLLLKSGITHPQLGKGLNEQVGVELIVDLATLKNIQGSTVTTGMGINHMLDESRRHQAGFMFFTVNRPRNLRLDPGKWLQRTEIIAVIEDLRREDNEVFVDPADASRPAVKYVGHSDYAERTRKDLGSLLEKTLAPLGLEAIRSTRVRSTESHIQGTTAMGKDPQTSVVDAGGRHHRHRNLVVLGSGNFPTASPANPSLTISALSLLSAHQLFA